MRSTHPTQPLAATCRAAGGGCPIRLCGAPAGGSGGLRRRFELFGRGAGCAPRAATRSATPRGAHKGVLRGYPAGPPIPIVSSRGLTHAGTCKGSVGTTTAGGSKDPHARPSRSQTKPGALRYGTGIDGASTTRARRGRILACRRRSPPGAVAGMAGVRRFHTAQEDSLGYLNETCPQVHVYSKFSRRPVTSLDPTFEETRIPT